MGPARSAGGTLPATALTQGPVPPPGLGFRVPQWRATLYGWRLTLASPRRADVGALSCRRHRECRLGRGPRTGTNLKSDWGGPMTVIVPPAVFFAGPPHHAAEPFASLTRPRSRRRPSRNGCAVRSIAADLARCRGRSQCDDLDSVGPAADAERPVLQGGRVQVACSCCLDGHEKFTSGRPITAASLGRLRCGPRSSVIALRASLQVPLPTDVGLDGRRGRRTNAGRGGLVHPAVRSPTQPRRVAGRWLSTISKPAQQQPTPRQSRSMPSRRRIEADRAYDCPRRSGPDPPWT